jgi:uncharacterized protein (DUF433 family)
MILPLPESSPPFYEDASGALRVGNSRVLLELVISDFLNGAAPDAIVEHFPSLRLADVYSAIAYYLHHQQEVDDYVRQREQLGEEVRTKIEANQRDISEFRAKLLARHS